MAFAILIIQNSDSDEWDCGKRNALANANCALAGNGDGDVEREEAQSCIFFSKTTQPTHSHFLFPQRRALQSILPLRSARDAQYSIAPQSIMYYTQFTHVQLEYSYLFSEQTLLISLSQHSFYSIRQAEANRCINCEPLATATRFLISISIANAVAL